MSTYTAVIGDVMSVGQRGSVLNGAISGATTPATVGGFAGNPRRSPQLASARIRTIVAPHIVSDSLGGLISADFTIPSEEALRSRPLLKYGVNVWLFDGRTPIFYGWAKQPVWTSSGDCQMTLAGPWQLFGTVRWREAWDLWDMTLLQRGQGDNKAGQVSFQSDGSLNLQFPAGATLAANDRVSVDYLLWDEEGGPFDARKITAFELDIRGTANLGANFLVRVIGKLTAGGSTGDLLYSSSTTGASGIQGGRDIHGTNQVAGAWTSPDGYRCIRIELISTLARTPLGNDTHASFDRIRFSTREAIFKGPASTMDTGEIARDVLLPRWTNGANSWYSTPMEFWASKGSAPANDETFVYNWGLDPVIETGTAPNTSVGITGFNAMEWQSPSEILASIAAVDGYNVGFYLPYNGALGYDPPGASGTDVGSFWLSAPPQLFWQPWADPNQSPDYTIHTQEGAEVTQQPDEQQSLGNLLYVNYQTFRGTQQSVGVFDANTQNYLTAQGYMREDDYTVQPSIGDGSTGTSIGNQVLGLRRSPSASATVAIENDGASRYPILKQGAVVAKLASIRPGSIRISDIPASSGLRSGYATHVEWWGQTIDSNERVELTVTSPGQMRLDRRLGWLALRANRQRVRGL